MDSGCSAVAAGLGEDVSGTAPHALAWLAVAGQEVTVLRRLAASLAGSPVSVVSILPVVDAAAVEAPGVAAVGMMLVGTVPGATWRRDVAPEDVLPTVTRIEGDPLVRQRLAAGEDPRLGRISRRNAVLVCSDARGDRCCGRYGPTAALAIDQAVGGEPRPSRFGWALARPGGTDVVACSDFGGHRFAPTAVVLPWGIVLGGLGSDPAPLVAAVADVFAGRPLVDGYRGRSTYPAHVQAAEAAARRHLAILGTNAGPDDIIVHGADPVGSRVGAAVAVPAGAFGTADTADWSDDTGAAGEATPDLAPGEGHLVRLRHSGGRTMRVRVRRVSTDVRRPQSCGGDPEPVTGWDTQVDADPPTGLWFVPGN